jgi:hypothetical protein
LSCADGDGLGSSADADAIVSEELAGTAHLAIGGEGVPLLVKVLAVDEIAEPEEGAFVLDRPLQPFPESLIVFRSVKVAISLLSEVTETLTVRVS